MDGVQFARRFVVRQPNQPDIHGVAFPSGLVLYDQHGIGLEAATSIDHVRVTTLDATVAETHDAVIHWAPENETPPSSTAGRR
ncbi:hypothetical protein [Streptomyces sp. NPDC048663]|uniref:hypothetical protein n=1 Tax=Streptomyces sp. NPDC048663 TaxID=3155638 RepID=UPI00344155E3